MKFLIRELRVEEYVLRVCDLAFRLCDLAAHKGGEVVRVCQF